MASATVAGSTGTAAVDDAVPTTAKASTSKVGFQYAESFIERLPFGPSAARMDTRLG
jgi:hypothetical protein